jgi:hypothetical protein
MNKGNERAMIEETNNSNTNAKKRDISYFLTSDVKPADENELLYDKFSPFADEDDFKLYLSIQKDGIREPLHISADGFILSGHRRHAAAERTGLDRVPCIVADDVVFKDMTHEERLSVLYTYNKQRDKNYSERLREAMAEVDPIEAHNNLLVYRHNRRRVALDINVVMGTTKIRARITTMKFLQAATDAIHSEREFWPLQVRRVHYLLLNDPPLRHDKKPSSTYQNDLASYKALTNLLVRARLIGEIPHEAIEDDTRPVRVVATYQNPADFIKYETEFFLLGYARDLLRGQAHHIEILVEKNAIRRHVEKVADEYCIPCTTGRGYASLTPRWKMVKRFKESGREKLILLILSDFDPDGEEIAASFPRSLRDDFGLSNVSAYKVAISGKDVKEHKLPFDMEAKKSSMNYKKFIEKHGVHVAELDAAPLELLQEKLREAIENCLDMDLFNAELAGEREDAAFIAATKKMIIKAIHTN